MNKESLRNSFFSNKKKQIPAKPLKGISVFFDNKVDSLEKKDADNLFNHQLKLLEESKDIKDFLAISPQIPKKNLSDRYLDRFRRNNLLKVIQNTQENSLNKSQDQEASLNDLNETDVKNTQHNLLVLEMTKSNSECCPEIKNIEESKNGN